MLNYFQIDLSEESDLVLLPIGFKKPISPIDFISNTSVSENSSKETKDFIHTIVEASERLLANEIDEPIFVDYKMNLTSVNRLKNADIIAGIDNTKENKTTFKIVKESHDINSSSLGDKITLTREKSGATGILYYEELKEGIFDEINNIVDANRLLSKNSNQFMLGSALYYRIYAERQHVNYNIETFDALAKAGMMEFYAPFLYWLSRLPADRIARILIESYNQCKSPKINNLIKIVILLGDEAIKLFDDLFKEKYDKIIQKPDFYYSFLDSVKSKRTNHILKALRVNKNTKLPKLEEEKEYTFGELLENESQANYFLSKECLNVFNGEISSRSITRELDFIVYGKNLINNKNIINELEWII